MRHRVSLLAAIAFLALSVGAATATAGGGNSANAKLCQKNGWQSLFTSTGGTFSSEETCVSYAAGGGTLLTSPPVSQSQTDCESFGGTFSKPNLPNTLWECDGWFNNPTTALQTLAVDCGNDASSTGLPSTFGPVVFDPTFSNDSFCKVL